MNLIELKNINRYFGQGEHRVHILKDINLTITQGEFIAIIGQSGSGKSTLMNILGCLDTPSSGSYTVNGIETASMSNDQLAALRRQQFGFIFQRYNLLGALSAQDNVALPAVYAGAPKAQRTARARQLLHQLGLEGKEHNRPNQLSGGQQQRVSIARALMNGGNIIFADEPTGALDSASGENVMATIRELNQQGHTIILVTHDPKVAAHAKRVIEIKDGRIIADSGQSPSDTPTPDHTTTTTANSYRFQRDQIIEAFKMSVQAIMAHKMRSLLTMLGIIIGIASVVSVVALGRGTQEKILADITAIGTSTISIQPGRGFGDRTRHRIRTLTIDDARAISQQPYVDSVTPVTSSSGTVTYRNTNATVQIYGAGEQYFNVRGIKIAEGRLFNAEEVADSAQVVVIDPNTRKQLFGDQTNPIGQVILFNKRPLRVIGITEPNDRGWGVDNLEIWAPYTTVMQRITGETHISNVTVKIKDSVNSTIAEQSLKELLLARHGKEDFFTNNSDSIKETIESTTGTMTLLISSIAFISLVVGGIGVMNIMLVSVTERTREIGVRMAIGARQDNILQQFLIEAVLICLTGGLTGILLSYGMAAIFNHFVSDFAMSFSILSIIGAVLCASGIGILFGFMPAKNASKLNPIEALSRD